MEKEIEFKVYGVYVKYVEVTIDDGDILTYEAYSPFPKGHGIEKQLVKLSLKDAMTKINEMDDADGLRMDYHGNTAYAPSTVRKVRWSADDDIAKNTYLVDVTGSKVAHKSGDVVVAEGKKYRCAKVIDWVKNFNTKFLYCTKYIEPKVVEPEVAEKEVKE